MVLKYQILVKIAVENNNIYPAVLMSCCSNQLFQPFSLLLPIHVFTRGIESTHEWIGLISEHFYHVRLDSRTHCYRTAFQNISIYSCFRSNVLIYFFLWGSFLEYMEITLDSFFYPHV